MARRIPDETLQAIRDRLSLTEVIAPYVSLKRAGRNFVGLCPFHSEKTPSFTVSDERGLFHCFGCGESGTVFTFVMKIERVDFIDAVTQLAKRAGVPLPDRDADDPAARRREHLYAVNSRVERFFKAALASPAGAGARRYLAERGLRSDTIARYGLGFAPAGGTALASWLAKENVPAELAQQAGVLARSNDGRVYDRFRGRVMFPIRDRRGRTIAFGGRTLGSDQPKYLNSPESPLFRKGEGLYGVAEARDAIRDASRAVLVEGYMDALLLAQEGIPYALATLGTALTAAQLRVLQPLGGDQSEVFFFFDGDRAGRAAAVRAFGVCAEAGVWGRAAFLPEGFDPDSYVRAHGAAATLALLDAAPSLVDFYFDATVPAGAPLQLRTRVAEEAKQIRARVRSDVQFDLLARRAAERLGLPDDVFLRARRAAAATQSTPPVRRTAPRWPADERLLVELIATDAGIATSQETRAVLAHFAAADLRDAGERLATAWETGRPVGEVADALDADLKQLVSAAVMAPAMMDADERHRAAADCVRRIEARVARTQRQQIASDLRHAERSGDEAWRAKLVDLNQVRRREGGVG